MFPTDVNKLDYQCKIVDFGTVAKESLIADFYFDSITTSLLFVQNSHFYLSFEILSYFVYRVFHWFRQARFVDGGSIFKLEPIFATPPAALNMKLTSKVVKVDSK